MNSRTPKLDPILTAITLGFINRANEKILNQSQQHQISNPKSQMTIVEPSDYSAEATQQTQQTQYTEVTINIPTNFAEAFTSLAEREGLTADALVMRSLGLYSVATQAEKGGYALSFTRIEGTNDLTAKEAIRIDDEPESNLFIPGKRK